MEREDDPAMMSVPVIDLGGLKGGDPAARERVARELGAAAEEWGFFQVVNHGIADELQDRMYEQARQFFDLPLHVKKRVQIVGPNPKLFGFNGFNGYSVDERGERKKEPIFIKEALADAFCPSTSLKDIEDLAVKIWPGGNSRFTDAMHKHCLEVRSLGELLLELLAESLGLQSDFFSRHFNETPEARPEEPAEESCTWRLHHFPRNPLPIDVLRTPPHTDPSVLTLLTQDVCGLQVMKPAGGSTWIDLQQSPGAYVVNVGNILEAWSNGRFRSGEHQVVLNKDTERLSSVLFLQAGPSWQIKTPPELVDDEHSSRFLPFIAGDFRVNFEKVKKLGDISKGQALDYVRRPSVS